jgi:hypothetical protein
MTHWWGDFIYKQQIYFCPPPEIEHHVSALGQQYINIKKDALQFVINEHEFKQMAILCGYDKIKGGH